MQTTTTTLAALVLPSVLARCEKAQSDSFGIRRWVVEEPHDTPTELTIANLDDGVVRGVAGESFHLRIAVTPAGASIAEVGLVLGMDDALGAAFRGPVLGAGLSLEFDGLPPGDYRLKVMQVAARAPDGSAVSLKASLGSFPVRLRTRLPHRSPTVGTGVRTSCPC